jgi:hypothetical protein
MVPGVRIPPHPPSTWIFSVFLKRDRRFRETLKTLIKPEYGLKLRVCGD